MVNARNWQHIPAYVCRFVRVIFIYLYIYWYSFSLCTYRTYNVSYLHTAHKCHIYLYIFKLVLIVAQCVRMLSYLFIHDVLLLLLLLRIYLYTCCTTKHQMMWNWAAAVLSVKGAALVAFDGSPGHPDLAALWRVSAEEGVTHLGASPK